MKQAIEILGRAVGPGHGVYVVAEISANHLGSFERATKLVEAAAAAGADAVKLQTYRPDTISLDCDRPEFVIRGGLWDGWRLFDLYREAQTPWEWHAPLFAQARACGIAMFSSAFDATAVELLDSLGAPAYKIASFEIVDLPLIERCAATGKPVILSTGIASLSEIVEAVDAAARAGSGGVALLHCVSGYPAPAEEMNLRTIPNLAETFGVPVGLSDHTLGTAVPVASVALGAVMIEKHLTLGRTDGGPDAAFSLEPAEFKAMAEACRSAYAALGAVSHNPVPSARANRGLRRSLYAVADIAAGERFDAANVRSVRPGAGLPPKHLPEILGRHARRAIKRGTPLSWRDVDD
ncbi:MAG TPA: pseudaminic acid synthase [Alphaproteobacteria bacterium]|jgi:N-acetylneuraminate synthase